MPQYKLVVLTAPVEGRKDEYNDWYQNVHLADVVAVPGIKSAQRFRLTKPLAADQPFPYLAIYEIETDDINATLDNMMSRSGTDRMVISDALGDTYAAVYEVFGTKVEA